MSFFVLKTISGFNISPAILDLGSFFITFILPKYQSQKYHHVDAANANTR